VSCKRQTQQASITSTKWSRLKTEGYTVLLSNTVAWIPRAAASLLHVPLSLLMEDQSPPGPVRHKTKRAQLSLPLLLLPPYHHHASLSRFPRFTPRLGATQLESYRACVCLCVCCEWEFVQHSISRFTFTHTYTHTFICLHKIEKKNTRTPDEE
jgi:hypothetical protein